MTDQQRVHECGDLDCLVESVAALRWQIDDLVIAPTGAVSWPDDLVVLASVRAFMTLRDVQQELDSSLLWSCRT